MCPVGDVCACVWWRDRHGKKERGRGYMVSSANIVLHHKRDLGTDVAVIAQLKGFCLMNLQ